MGFSPGEFVTSNGREVHFELKDGPRIVLWTDGEMNQLLDLSVEQARIALDQLQLLILMTEDM